MLSAALGSPTTITLADLERPDVRDKVRSLLSGISRTAGSSAWLADLYLKGLSQGVQYDAMWNYEAVLAETNQILKDRNQELLYAIYPSDGMAIANSPLGFVDRGRGPSALKFSKHCKRTCSPRMCNSGWWNRSAARLWAKSPGSKPGIRPGITIQRG
jgi:hypothetical protein